MSAFEERGVRPSVSFPALDDTDAHRVRYELSCADFADAVEVHGLEVIEELNRPYVMTVRVEGHHETTELGELLGRDVAVRLHRGDHTRAFFGIVGRVRVDGMGHSGPVGTLEIVPALWALGFSEDSRIFQEKSAVDIVEMVLNERLGPYGRRIDTASLDRERYLSRDYCVQYRESALDFVHRLLEEEGIGYCFRHEDEGPETLVLFDDNADLTRVRTMNQGPVRFEPELRAWAGEEPISQLGIATALTPSRVAVREHDWTRARPTVEGASADEPVPTARHAHEVYEHGFDRQLTVREDHELVSTLVQAAVRAAMPFGPPPGLAHMVHDLPGVVLDGFSSSNVAHQVGIRRERQRRDARTCHGVGAVIGFSPGCVFELVGHPGHGADGKYLLTKVVHRSEPKASPRPEDPAQAVSHNYECVFECLPVTTAWRPDRRTKKPRIYGVQTARVTGPVGMDVHTDAYGRIKARFPWDRAPDDLSGHYTCWLRVSQTWAGQGGPGFMFIPRVGMEVVVSFVDGDPDRPLVTGCVYNGANPTPGMLPVQATKSILRTRTVPHGPGHNEISFEDALGMERVHIRAQRDLDELVLNDHVTAVVGNQHNQVSGHQSELVLQHQQLTVQGNRSVQVQGVHSIAATRDHCVDVGGSEVRRVAEDYELTVDEGSALVEVRSGSYALTASASLSLAQGERQFIDLASADASDRIVMCSGDATLTLDPARLCIQVGRSSIVVDDSGIRLNGKFIPASASNGEPR
jgi:type VI secretion system secreted protein VgrG